MKEPASLPWPTMASEALYGLPGKIVRSIDPFTEADPAAVLIHVLAAFGNIIGPGSHICRDCRGLLERTQGNLMEHPKGTIQQD